MKLAAWIKAYGVAKLARGMAVSKTTVYRWINGEDTPSDLHKRLLVKLAKGKLSLDDVTGGRDA